MGIVDKALGGKAQNEAPPQQGQVAAGNAGGWNDDKVLQTATMLAFETLYSQGGAQALEERLAGSQDLMADMADIAVNVIRSALAKAQANGRTIPPDALQKLAMTLIFEVLQVAGIMGLVQEQQAKPMAQQMLPMVMQGVAQPSAAGRIGGKAPAGQPAQQGGLVNQAMTGGAQ